MVHYRGRLQFGDPSIRLERILEIDYRTQIYDLAHTTHIVIKFLCLMDDLFERDNNNDDNVLRDSESALVMASECRETTTCALLINSGVMIINMVPVAFARNLIE